MRRNRPTVYAAAIKRHEISGWVRELPFLLLANLVLVLSAYVEIPLPFTPVPITGQTLGVMLIAMALGRTRATAVTLAYLVEGALGAPVFAGGAAGFGHLMGPTGGYLVGFLPAAYVTGWLADKGWDKSYFKSILAMLLGHILVFGFGLAQLSFFVPRESLLAMGLTPFLVGTAIKTGIASLVLPSIWHFLNRSGE